MVFFHSNTRCDLLFQESIIFFTSYQVTVNLLICSVYQSLKEESGSLRKHVRFSSMGSKDNVRELQLVDFSLVLIVTFFRGLLLVTVIMIDIFNF